MSVARTAEGRDDGGQFGGWFRRIGIRRFNRERVGDRLSIRTNRFWLGCNGGNREADG